MRQTAYESPEHVPNYIYFTIVPYSRLAALLWSAPNHSIHCYTTENHGAKNAGLRHMP